MQLGLVFGGVIGALMTVFAQQIPRIFTNDPAVIATAAAVLPILAAFEPVCGLVFVWVSTASAARSAHERFCSCAALRVD